MSFFQVSQCEAGEEGEKLFYIRGGYTSPAAHAYELRHVLASPVDDHLFFAGEATSSRSCSTVPTAIETGTRAADEVCCAAGILPLAKL